MEERYRKLRKEVDDLLEWKRSNSVQQIPFNPPVTTTKLMQKDMLVTTGKTISGFGVYDLSLEVSFDGDLVWLPAKLQL